jgi:hypothetical protein
LKRVPPLWNISYTVPEGGIDAEIFTPLIGREALVFVAIQASLFHGTEERNGVERVPVTFQLLPPYRGRAERNGLN